MSRDLADESYTTYHISHGGVIPVKYMNSPDPYKYKKYSTVSDVWAYGCLYSMKSGTQTSIGTFLYI